MSTTEPRQRDTENTAPKEITDPLFQFLRSQARRLEIEGHGTVGADEVRAMLRELIPAEIQVRGINTRKIAAVISAPHVSFDHWSEYYCNRLAQALKTGWVVARNYRDRDGFRIPGNIGRHVHVNRPTETPHPGLHETRTARAESVYNEYLAALQEASSRLRLPLDLLIEIHSHRKHMALEIATVGVSPEFADAIHARYSKKRSASSPPLYIEPRHQLKLSAHGAKSEGVMRTEIARHAFHIEVPLSMRMSEQARRAGMIMVSDVCDYIVRRVEEETVYD